MTKRVEDALEQNKSRNKKNTKNSTVKTKSNSGRINQDIWDIVFKTKLKYANTENDLYDDPLAYPWKSEMARIKEFSQKFKDQTIKQSFAIVYNDVVNDLVNSMVGNEVPRQLHVGDVIKLKIKSIANSKHGGVVFDSGIYKENFMTRNNLASFEKLRKFLPVDPIPVKVVEITPKATFVDVFGQMVDEFILPRITKPWSQNKLTDYVPVKVKDLKLVRGGYLGKAVIPNVSEFAGTELTIDAFVPGSQIVQNTTDDFAQFEGKTVDTFITAWTPKPNGNGMSLVCSAKNLIKHRGNLKMKSIYDLWCDQDEKWEAFKTIAYEGRITGVINSSKKCGVFVEIPDLEITGMIPTSADELVNYKAGTNILVNLTDFDEELYYNDSVDQYQHIPAFVIEDGAIKKVNVKPILSLA